MPRALVAPTLVAVCPTSSAIAIFSGALEVQLAASAGRTCNVNKKANGISSHAIGAAAFFAILPTHINFRCSHQETLTEPSDLSA